MDGVGMVPAAMGMSALRSPGEYRKGWFRGRFSKPKSKDCFPISRTGETANGHCPGSLIGFFHGDHTGVGAAIPRFWPMWPRSAFPTPEKFGTGIIEGVASPETAKMRPAAAPWLPSSRWGSPAMVVMADGF